MHTVMFFALLQVKAAAAANILIIGKLVASRNG
jgi:hypothetical protein